MRIKTLPILIVILITLFSCESEKKEGLWDPMKWKSNVENNMPVPVSGNTYTFECTNYKSFWISNILENGVNVYIEPGKEHSGEWYTVIVEKNIMTITFSANTTTSDRTLNICVTAGDIFSTLSFNQGHSNENISLEWTSLIDDSMDSNEFDISSKYLGIQGWSSIANPPTIYIGATFPEKAFATTFDREVTGEKYPIELSFNFSIPYTTNMETVNYNGYLKRFKDAIKSEEYSNHKLSSRPYLTKLAELKDLNNLDLCFSDNRDFGITFKNIIKQKLDMKKAKTLCIGKIIFKSFNVSMEVPTEGLFVENQKNLEELVYISSLTYGTSAYFVIGSNEPYEDILSAFKHSFMDDYNNPKGTLHNSQIIILTTYDINQESYLKTTFNDLDTYIKNPFNNGENYGYPIFCKGYNAKDNSLFINNINK